MTSSASHNRPTHEDGLIHGVVVGCCDEQGRWLVIRRSEHVAAPLQVCFPGGAKEHGETERETAVREAHEELGLQVEPLELVWDWLCPYRPLRLFGFFARITGGELTPDPHEVSEAMWLTPEEIVGHPDILKGTELFVEQLQIAAQSTDAANSPTPHK